MDSIFQDIEQKLKCCVIVMIWVAMYTYLICSKSPCVTGDRQIDRERVRRRAGSLINAIVNLNHDSTTENESNETPPSPQPMQAYEHRRQAQPCEYDLDSAPGLFAPVQYRRTPRLIRKFTSRRWERVTDKDYSQFYDSE